MGEQSLNLSGRPIVHIRAGIFVVNPILSWFPILDLLARGELRLPFGDSKLAPIAGHDVAKLCAKILRSPADHVAKAYILIGPKLKGTADFAKDYAAVLRRPVAYVPQDLESWNENHMDKVIGAQSAYW